MLLSRLVATTMQTRAPSAITDAHETSAMSVRHVWSDSDGVILPYVAIILGVIIGLSALALDGSRLIVPFLPREWHYKINQYEFIIYLVFFALIFFAREIVLWPVQFLATQYLWLVERPIILIWRLLGL